ncbi:MAG: hypothetical protein Q8942_05195 [Bacillota bacterium]|nr:hypothetical protein [Bacillota bacterium]
MELRDIKPEDELLVFDKPSRKIRERRGKYVARNDSFLTIQFQHYKDTLLLSDLRQGKATIFINNEELVFSVLLSDQ